MSSWVEVRRDGAVLIITINRPDKRNAINREMSLAIARALDELDSDSTLRVGILTGAGAHFCAGMDLQAFADGRPPELEGRGFGGLTEMPPQKPLVAAVEGFALAGGLELALACDLIIAGDTAMFGLPEVRLGLIAGSGGLIRLPDRIPRSLATKYALTGERFSAREAERHGMVVETCATGDALNRALLLAREIAANAPLSVQMTKRILNEFSSDRESGVWQRQAPLIEEVLSSADATEGALAFTEKRNPMWSGT